MSIMSNGMFEIADSVQMESLNQRLVRNKVITSNIANAETPGFRALGYDFETQLRAVMDKDQPFPMKVSDPRHYKSNHLEADGTILPDVFIRPTESVPEDGNTVDLDGEMGKLAKNHILYRASVELINRKVGILKYAISGGR